MEIVVEQDMRIKKLEREMIANDIICKGIPKGENKENENIWQKLILIVMSPPK